MGEETMGMTNEQYYGLLVDDIDKWETMLELLPDSKETQKAREYAEKQISNNRAKLKAI